MYTTVHDKVEWGGGPPPDWNGGPIEPWNHDAAWGVKWVIEDQINLTIERLVGQGLLPG